MEEIKKVDCPCPQKNCKNHGICSACVVKHKNTDSLPFCLFPENTGDKSIKSYYGFLKAKFKD